MKTETTAFVYCRENKINVLTFDQSVERHNALIGQGWKHTATLDIFVFMQYLLNVNSKERNISIKELKK